VQPQRRPLGRDGGILKIFPNFPDTLLPPPPAWHTGSVVGETGGCALGGIPEFGVNNNGRSNMMRAIQRSVVCVAVLVAVTAQVHAAAITFSTSQSQFNAGINNQGWWSSTKTNSTGNDNYFVGRVFSDTLRNFFTFDLSSLGSLDNVTSATLRLRRSEGNFGNESTETIDFFDVSTDAATLNNNVGTSAAIFNDLGTGTSFGSFTVAGSGAETEILSFTLNASAIGDINAAKGGFFSVGGDLTSQDGNDFLFGDSTGFVQELVLNVGPAAAVPEPSSLVLFSLGLVGLVIGTARRRRREKSTA